MDNLKTPKERLLAYISYKNMTVKEFERRCGLSNAYVKNMIHKPSPKKLDFIGRAFPDLNLVWVVSGVGDMLADISRLGLRHNENEIDILREKVKTLTELLDTKDELICSLRDCVSMLKEKLASQKNGDTTGLRNTTEA